MKHPRYCEKGHVECARLLVNARAAVEQANVNGATPLYIACQKGHLEIARRRRDRAGPTGVCARNPGGGGNAGRSCERAVFARRAALGGGSAGRGGFQRRPWGRWSRRLQVQRIHSFV